MGVAIRPEVDGGGENETDRIRNDFDGQTLAETAGILLPKLISEYRTLASEPAPEDHKAFATFHTACRTALNHLILLEKLTGDGREEEAVETEVEPHDGIEALLSRAQEVLARHTVAAE